MSLKSLVCPLKRWLFSLLCSSEAYAFSFALSLELKLYLTIVILTPSETVNDLNTLITILHHTGQMFLIGLCIEIEW